MSLIIRVFKGWKTDSLEDSWVNNYEISTALKPQATEVVDIVEAIVTAEQALHLPNVRFIQATVSTWLPDSDRYDPYALKSIPLSVNGTQFIGSGGQDPVDMNVTLMLRGTVNQGRAARRMYRGCLQKGHITAGDNMKFRLIPGSTFDNGGDSLTRFQNAMAPLFQDTVLGNTESWLAIIGRYKNDAGQYGNIIERPITGFVPGGVVINKTNHKYFDRA